MKGWRFLVLFAALGLFTAWSATVSAQPTEADKATARQLAIEAYDALDAKQFDRAEELFTRAERLHHAPTLLLGLARAQVGLGKYVEARENYIRILREKLPAGASDAFVSAVSSARTEIAGLETKIAWVTIRVSGPSQPTVLLDEVEVPLASLGVKRAVNPGSHEVSAEATGYLEQRQSFEITPGKHQDIVLELEVDPNAPSEPAATPPPPTATASPTSTSPPPPPGPDTGDPGATQRMVGFVSVGLGGAALVMGIITGVLAMGAHSDLEDGCQNEVCPESLQSTIDSYDVTSTLSTVGFIAGGVLAAAGVVLILTAPDAQEPQVSLRLGPAAARAVVRF